MGNIKEVIELRIKTLEKQREEFIKKGDIPFSNSTWARLEEMKALKKSFTDKSGNWTL